MYNPQLTTFISVAENGSFTKAAEALYITPTAVMKQINVLEDRLGIALFDRTNHGLQLTDAGTLEGSGIWLRYTFNNVKK